MNFVKYIYTLRTLFLLLLVVVTSVTYAQNYSYESVLKDGTWFKIGVKDDGVYKISYNDLINLGVDIDNVKPKKISLFGNENGVLPESNSAPAYDDLSEMSIIVTGENDDSFDENDAILFYAQSPIKWEYTDKGRFVHNTNYYSDTSFYFLTLDNKNDGKRISESYYIENHTDKYIDVFQDYQTHELDLNNRYRQGKLWYGETISLATSPEHRFTFVFDNILPNRESHVRLNMVGSSSSEVFYARIKANDEILFDSLRISKSGSYYFGHEIDKNSIFFSDNDTVNIDVAAISTNSTSLIGVNFIDVNVWRELKYENKPLHFNIFKSFPDTDSHDMLIGNANENLHLFDITDPLNPVRCNYLIEDGMIKYHVVPDVRTYYILFDESDHKDVEFIRQIENQNLHSISSAEMLIITHPLFKEEAERLKKLHEDYDGLLSVVVEVDEIYNEFSTGAPDVTAIRNFIRMVYSRDNSLKYVLLFGRGTSDYKNVMGADNNFVPPYESIVTYSEINSYVSDDYFALMDPAEGEECKGTVDLGVGRIPVSSKQEASDVVNKIHKYIESQYRTHDIEWRDKFLFVADDDIPEYPKNCDRFEKIIDTSMLTASVDKIYTDSYVRTKVADGYLYPEATQDLINKIEEGRLFITYTGHGGVKGLTNEGLFREEHIKSLKNIDNMPFVHTGTCEFSKFDDPMYVSAGEQLFLNPNGGAIGMITTTRPTQISPNYSVGLYLYKAMFKDGKIRDITFGEMIRMVKATSNSNSPNYLCYVMFGDPALRLAYPEKDIKINEIIPSDNDSIHVLSAMSHFVVRGEIMNDNQRDVTFNGIIYPKMFDSESDFSTLDNDNNGSVYNFSFFKNVVYEGKAEVKDGTFEFSVVIPKSLTHQDNNARLSMYAVDTVDYSVASSRYDNFVIEGVDENVHVDDEGPAIEMLWTFTNDDSGILDVHFYDEQGIMHYDNYIGRDILLIHEYENKENTIILNDLYDPQLNDYTRGSLSFVIESLEAADHIFTVRAWDTHDNSSQNSVVVSVEKPETQVVLKDVLNKPNPFKEETNIYFDYTKDRVFFDLRVDIYDMLGKKINTLEYSGLDDKTDYIRWDASDFSGNEINSGVYIFKIYLKDSEGDEFYTTQRMIKL